MFNLDRLKMEISLLQKLKDKIKTNNSETKIEDKKEIVVYDESTNVSPQTFQMLPKHFHNYNKIYGDYKFCQCGKKILRFEEIGNKMVGIRKNGVSFSKKADQNRFFRPQEWESFEDILPKAMRHTCKMLLHTGARISELQQVKIEDFVYSAMGRSTIILRHTKTKARKGEQSGKPRTIPLSKSFAKYLAEWIRENEKQGTDNFNIRSTAAVNIAMKKAAKKLNLVHPEDFSAHTLRKTLEVWLMALGTDSLSLVAHLGHDIKTAAAHYVSPDIFSNEDKNRIRRILGDLYLRQNN